MTHNIEEAVLLADRIIVLGRNPAKIRADFRIPLAPAARSQVAGLSSLRGLHLQGDDAAGAGPGASFGSERTRESRARRLLPHARPGGVAGLLELLNDREGEEDMYHIAEDLLLEVDDLLPIIDAARAAGIRHRE